MQVVPLLATPSQKLNAVLSDQFVTLEVRQLRYNLIMNVYLDGTLIVGGVECLNNNLIVRDAYFGFTGDFVWNDTQGDSDPYYTGFGDRFRLLYLTPDEIAAVAV